MAGATVTISITGQPGSIIERLTTDDSGQTPLVELPAPALEYSMEPSEVRPYSEYDISVEAPGYEPVVVEASEVLPDVTSLQPISMIPEQEPGREEDIFIPDHTLYGDYPPKIPEAEIKPMDETGEIVLSRVVIPEYVCGSRWCALRFHSPKLLCPVCGLHQKCGFIGNLRHLA